jgi:hypothetical protein
MPYDEKAHGNGFYSGSTSPPKTNVTSLLNQYADAAKRCGEPGSLPVGYWTREVSRRCRIPWAAKLEDRTLAAVMTVRNMTDEDMEHFKEDLEKSAADWTRRQTEQANGGESGIGEAENNTEVATKGAETDEARSREMRGERSWTRRGKKNSRSKQRLSMREKSLNLREQDLSLREKSLLDAEHRLSRSQDTLGRGGEALRVARLRFQEESQDQAQQTGWTGTSSVQGEDQQISRQRRRNRSKRIHVSVPGSSRARVSSITVNFD